nr:hypothetical protein [uncultured Cohaesibacter sp.]
MFSEVVYRDGWQLFWRLKWRYLQLVCLELILFLILPFTELLGVSLIPSIVGALIFFAGYLVARVFVFYSSYNGVLRSDPLKTRYDLDFRLFFRFWIKVKLKFLLILVFVIPALFLFYYAFVPDVVAPFLVGGNAVETWKSSPDTWGWLIGCYFIFCCVIGILDALFAAKIAGGNAGFLYAFRRIPEALIYALVRSLPLIVLVMAIGFALSAFPLKAIVATPLDITMIAGVLATNAILRMVGCVLDAVWTVLSCRLYLRTDGKVHLNRTNMLTMPYLN